MALQGPFFGKREGEQQPLGGGAPRPLTPPPIGSHPAGPAASTAAPASIPPSTQSFGLPLSVADPMSAAPAAGNNSAKLTVGPNIKLKGVEITNCDTLVIEGTVEAAVHSRVLQIAEPGAYKGSAEIDIAEVRGVFDGNLTARHKLVIFATGKVTGKIRYGKIVIEEGGQISGDITVDGEAKRSGDGRNANAT